MKESNIWLQVADIYSGLECYDLVAAVGDTITIKGWDTECNCNIAWNPVKGDLLGAAVHKNSVFFSSSVT